MSCRSSAPLEALQQCAPHSRCARPMTRILTFDALLFIACGYALWRGSRAERVAGLAMAVAYLATLASYSQFASRFAQVETGVLVVDLLLLIVLVAVALKADRGWPMGLAAFQLDTVGAHIARLLDLDMIRVTYAVMLAMWSYPMLALLVAGTWRYRRRCRQSGDIPVWGTQKQRALAS